MSEKASTERQGSSEGNEQPLTANRHAISATAAAAAAAAAFFMHNTFTMQRKKAGRKLFAADFWLSHT